MRASRFRPRMTDSVDTLTLFQSEARRHWPAKDIVDKFEWDRVQREMGQWSKKKYCCPYCRGGKTSEQSFSVFLNDK